MLEALEFLFFRAHLKLWTKQQKGELESNSSTYRKTKRKQMVLFFIIFNVLLFWVVPP